MTGEKQIENIKVRRAIVRVVSFFDVFDFPLTEFEIWKFLEIKTDLNSVNSILDIMRIESELSFLDGYYYLKGRRQIITTRLMRYNYAERKYKRAFYVSEIFKFIPWVQLVAVGNIIGAGNLRDRSDIDLFIIASPGRLWLTRFFCTVLMKLARMRPSPGDERDKICLSFYVSEKELDLEKLMFDNSDLYFIYWLACLNVIYKNNKTYEKFIAKNVWLKKRLPNWLETQAGTRQEVYYRPFAVYRKVLDILLAYLESMAEALQIKALPVKIKQEMNKSTCVVVSSDIIKLHTNDRRTDFLCKFNTHLAHSEKKENLALNELITGFRKKLPSFEDGRIDYTDSNEAPIVSCFVQAGEKFLLLKRSDKVGNYKNKWNTVAGFLDDDKLVINKALEEFQEELGLKLEDILEKREYPSYKYFDANVKKTWVVFPVLFKIKEEKNVKLDWEHTEYKWLRQNEIKEFDTVPDLEISMRNIISS